MDVVAAHDRRVLVTEPVLRCARCKGSEDDEESERECEPWGHRAWIRRGHADLRGRRPWRPRFATDYVKRRLICSPVVNAIWSKRMLVVALSTLLSATATVTSEQPSGQEPSEKHAVAAIRKALRSNDVAAWQTAFDDLLPFDSEVVAKTIVAVRERIEVDVAETTKSREEMRQEAAQIIKGQETSRSRQLPSAGHARFQELEREIAALRKRLDACRLVLENVDSKLERLRDEKAARFLLTKVIGDARRSLALKLAAAERCPGSANS